MRRNVRKRTASWSKWPDMRAGLRYSVALCLLGIAAAPGAQAAFVLRSHDMAHGALSKSSEYRGFGCHGRNRSPELSWSGAPAGTKSFVLTVFDKSARHLTESGWWHWVLVNIPARVHRLPRGAGTGPGPQDSQEVRTDFGAPGYGGPCPPRGDGTHDYVFTLYALKVAHMAVSEGTTGAAVTFMARHEALGSATLVGRFGR